MDYDTARHLADSWGLVFLLGTFVIAVGWAFRPGSSYKNQAEIPFRNDDEKL